MDIRMLIVRGRWAAAGFVLAGWGLCAGAAVGADRIEAELLPAPRPVRGEQAVRIAKLRGQAERIRGLKLKSLPPWSGRTRGEIYRYFTRLVQASGREREVSLATKLYAGFGFWPRDFDLVKVQLRAQSGAVGAFYTPAERCFTLVPHGLRSTNSYVRIEKDAQVVHEYVHALQDQHLKLSELKMFSGNDRQHAIRALVEGDAVLAMSMYAVGVRGGRQKERRLVHISRETARRRGGMRAILRTPVMKKAPRIIGVNMVFPYIGGSMFVERAYRKGGWGAVNGLYRVPPISSEQIIHPEKYFVPPGRPIEDPIEIRLPELPGTVLSGARRVDVDTLGELEITVLLSDYVDKARARAAAAGWGGDRYVAYERTAGSGAGELVICWLTLWDEVKDAREFFSAYARVQEKKCGVRREALDEDGHLLDWRGAGARRRTRLELWGAAVLSIEGADAVETARLADLLWTAKRRRPKPRYGAASGKRK